ncbi:hypothetical protein [Kutzneria albida]|uniref:Uncharacterized protein n=1 Tax=Kutzneria albida DSM 43870 TaxID=1449976 RepID=W5W9P9_9PSEU|nr:hypothetical protein [Kutzneria albida]AHH94934.1 hypothetical protein KALB_1562 [Kutzneria albida DSM 43870]
MREHEGVGDERALVEQPLAGEAISWALGSGLWALGSGLWALGDFFVYPTPWEITTTGARTWCRLPLWLAVIARSNRVRSTEPQSRVRTPRVANTSATPSVTVEFGGVLNTSCTRGSESNRPTMSRSRFAEATVLTIIRTVWECPTVDWYPTSSQ